MDRTEITNEQYHRFVNYVADSLKYLIFKNGTIDPAFQKNNDSQIKLN
jgi:formylglycine-generating enzyme required for sulfatase activity